MQEMLSVPAAPTAPTGSQDHAPSAAGKDTQGPPFKDVLKDHQARTADAEGHDKPVADDKVKGKTSADKDATTPKGEATDPTATPAGAVAQALALTVVAPATPVAATAPAAAAEAVTSQAAAPTGAVLAAVAETAAGVPAEVTGEATATTAATTPESAAATALPAGTTKPADGKPADGKPAVELPAALANATGAAPAATPATADATQVAPNAAAATAPAGEKAAEPQAAVQTAAPQPAPAPAQAPVHQSGPAPAQAPHAPAPTAAPSPLNTAQAVERIQAMVHMAHSRGAAQARIELHPAELGGVTIQLHVAHDGLRAHIAADRPEALPLLQRAAADLQRSLESRGIDLSGLDFGLAPDAEAGASHDQGRAQGRENPFGGPGRLGSEDEADAVDAVTTTTRSVELPAGALVDVRA